MTASHPAPTARRRPGWLAIAVLALVGWLAVGGLGGPLVGKLSTVQKNDQASFLPAGAESTKAREVAARFQPQTTLPYFVVVTRDSGLTPADLAAVRRYADSVPGLRLPGSSTRTVKDFLAGPVVAIPSQDGKALLVPVTVDSTRTATEVDGIKPVGAVAEALRTARDGNLRADGLQAYVAGPGGFTADLTTAFAGIDGILLLVALGVVLVILLVVYRSPVLPIAVLVTAIFGLAAAGLVLYPLAEGDRLSLSGQSQGILSILVVGAATDYALLLVARYKEELHDQEDHWTALARAWRGSVEPIVASGGTVVLGLLCLLLSDLGNNRSLGPIGALGIAGAILAALTFLPAVLGLAGRRIFWPAIPRVDHAHAEDALADTSRRTVWGRVARLVGDHPRRAWVASALLLAACAACVPVIEADGAPQSSFFTTPVESVTGGQALAEHFPGGSGAPVQVIVAQDRLARAAAAVTGIDGVASVVPFSGQPGGAGGRPGAGEPPKAVDGRVLLQATTTAAADTPAAQDVVREIRAAVHPIDESALVGGTAAQGLDSRDAGVHDLRVVGPAILLVVFLVLVLLLRSLVAPILLTLANVLSFAATMGVFGVLFFWVLDCPGVDPTVPLYGFVFLVALGIDYSIFLMTRVREEARARGTREGVLVGLAVTGGVITSAGIVLAATFSALGVLPLSFLVQVAFIVAFGVLLDTFVVRSLLVPALVRELGPRTWWPSALSREAR
ncbi:MMPL family transporter [Arsenicicoccus dermatophilus]|uniref:MMPL family transporter n=1 Tax=Arsenicicoccus dermatophilus TaxID=1076331 RepID=UPI001F4C7202|nr:MMPL family transporter [Arsenicicoccus dermatophilus]MCH8613506.1 MMPL family transporter [Arsenicicoccus dermatophilus]